MKIKSKGTAKKRFKVTAKGKLKHAVGQWNHLRLKKGIKAHQRKSKKRVIRSNRQVRKMKSMMGS